MDVVARARQVNAALNETPGSPAEPAPDGPRHPLPPPEPPRADLASVLAERRSSYSYARRTLTLAALSSLLHHAVGVQRFVTAYGTDRHPLGMAPSAGGLPSLRTYLLVRDAESLPPGVYRYDAVAHELVERSAGDPSEHLTGVYLQPEFVPRVPVTLALTVRLDVAFGRYPLRHYRTLHVDTGIAAQNLYLVATALGLACCAVSGYRDDPLAALLGLGAVEIPTILFPVGHTGQ